MARLGFVVFCCIVTLFCGVLVDASSISLNADANKPAQSIPDHHSYANIHQIKISHAELDLSFNFDEQRISGNVTLTLERKEPTATTLVLDTMDLFIDEVTVEDKNLEFYLGEANEELGSPLYIKLPPQGKKVSIKYHTGQGQEASFWLNTITEENHLDSQFYTLTQPTGARSLFPLQDSPQVKFTYDAKLTVPKGLTAIMGAERLTQPEDGVFTFKMPKPVPAFLLGIAIADYEFREIGSRAGVFASKDWIKPAAKEFEDSEKILVALEKLYGKYRWERQDIVIMPLSFPVNGMEYPSASFISPLLIDGHKTSALILAHEIAHAWAGNLVTAATWEDLWLSESITHYMAYRTIDAVYGSKKYRMQSTLGYEGIAEDFINLPENQQILDRNKVFKHASDAFGHAIYEKGPLFLREIEELVGRNELDLFLKKYFQYFAFQSITTEQFLNYLNEQLINKFPKKLSLDRIKAWVFQPSLPKGHSKPTSQDIRLVKRAIEDWGAGKASAVEIKNYNFNIHQQLYLLQQLPSNLSSYQLFELDSAFQFSKSPNHNVRQRWLRIGITHWEPSIVAEAEDYLYEMGFYVEYIFDELYETREGSILADEICEKIRNCW